MEYWAGYNTVCKSGTYLLPSILPRYITIQLLERSVSPSRLEIKEIEMEGWGRLCGHPCLGLNVPAISDYYQVTQGACYHYLPPIPGSTTRS